MAAPKSITRYASCDSRSSFSSQLSDASSTDLNPKPKGPSFRTLIGNSTSARRQPESNTFSASNSSRALIRTKSSQLPSPSAKNDHNFTSLVKKFMEKKSKPKMATPTLVIPADFIAEDLKKNSAVKGGSSFHKKLFQKAASADRTQRKALKDVTDNTRTLSMVLKSERDLMTKNKEYELEIVEIRRMLDQKNGEVEKLKDLCLKQREEIKALKNAVLFPDLLNSQTEEFFNKQGSELKQAREVIPSLQKQVTSLTGQLQCLAAGLAEVKADKYAARSYFDGHMSSPRTPVFDQEAANSLEFSSEDPLTPGSPDDLVLRDMNPCLTPYYAKTRSKDYEYDALHEDVFGNMSFKENCLDKRQSMSPRCLPKLSSVSTVHVTSKSDENAYRYGKPTYHKLF